MEKNNPLLIVIDAGHGGYDNGAMWEGRREKDDNLRLALAVRDALMYQGVDVLMTRDTDVFIPLADRAAMANEAEADLFVSLHRDSYPEQTPTSNGVQNFIYLTADEDTSGRAAQLVLDALVDVGVQSNRGVSRGNYYVVRRTKMPSMLLEMGFIIDDEDNRLFDENLEAYAQAIAKGIMEYFGLEYLNPCVASDGALPAFCSQPVEPVPPIQVLPPVEVPVLPVSSPVPIPLPEPSPGRRPPAPNYIVATAQQALNNYFGAGILADGIYDLKTRSATVRALQSLINRIRSENLPLDGVIGAKTKELLPTLREGDQGDYVLILQILLSLHGYEPGNLDGIFGPMTKTAVQLYQRDHYLIPDGVAGPRTLLRLLI